MPPLLTTQEVNTVPRSPSVPLTVVLDQTVRDSLPAFSGGGTLVFTLFAVSHLFLLPAPIAPIMSAVATATALIFLTFRLWLREHELPLSAVNAVIALFISLVLINSLLHLALMHEIKHTSNIALLIIVIGGLSLARSWFYGMVGVVVLGWLAVLGFVSSSPDVSHYIIMVGCAIMLALVLHNSRLRSVTQLYELHLQDERQQYALEQAIATLRENDVVLQQARAAAEQANVAKSEFIAMVSHELKTPLAVIIGFTDLMRMPSAKDSDHSQSVDMIRRNGLLMHALIEDLNHLSEVESMSLTLTLETIRLVTAVRSVASGFGRHIEEHGQRIEVDISDDIFVRADSLRLVQILNNVVSNAVKYSPDGGLITIRSLPSDDGMVEVVVRDHGIGIATIEQAQLFERFFRASNGKERRIVGTGLGLYITRRLLDLHGGKIWIESALGRGTSVYFTLPVALHAMLEVPTLVTAGQAITPAV